MEDRKGSLDIYCRDGGDVLMACVKRTDRSTTKMRRKRHF